MSAPKLDFVRAERDGALVLLNEMLAIHAMAYDPEVAAEAYAGEAHENAEEVWLRKVKAFLLTIPESRA